MQFKMALLCPVADLFYGTETQFSIPARGDTGLPRQMIFQAKAASKSGL
jgi:hypothetical protein